MPPEPTLLPLNRLERLVLEHVDVDLDAGFEVQCERVRRWLRAEVTARLRELAEVEPLETPCRGCGEPVEVSPSYYEKVRAGRVPAPPCYRCKRPARAAKSEAEAVLFVEDLGERVGELAGSVAALRWGVVTSAKSLRATRVPPFAPKRHIRHV